MTIARISIDNCSGDAAEGNASAAIMITIDATNLINGFLLVLLKVFS